MFERIYNDAVINKENQQSIFFNPIPNILSNSEIDQSGKGTLFEFYIISILELSKNKIFELHYHSIAKNKNQNTITWKKKKISLKYDFCEDIFPGNLENIKQLKDNCILIPKVSNFFALDFIYWEKQKNCFYVFQCTVNVISHKRSDINFMKSDFYQKLLATQKNCQIRFIWICGPHEITTETIGMEYEKANHFDEKSGFLFPKENTHVFRNLTVY